MLAFQTLDKKQLAAAAQYVCTACPKASHFVHSLQIQGQARSFPFQSWVEHPNSIEGELRLICDLDCEWDPHSGILLDSWSLSAFIGASGRVGGVGGKRKTCKNPNRVIFYHFFSFKTYFVSKLVQSRGKGWMQILQCLNTYCVVKQLVMFPQFSIQLIYTFDTLL